MSDKHTRLAALLIDLECALRQNQLWFSRRPFAEALASTKPFAVDTLEFPQWLQFIFIERMQILIETQGELPSRCDIAPMAEEYFRGLALSGENIIKLLAEIDKTIND